MSGSLKRILESANAHRKYLTLDQQHPLADYAFQKSHFYKEISEYESRLQELVDYFGYETGSKAPYCRIYGGQEVGLPEKLGISSIEYQIMHMHALFNRISPLRRDLYYVFDSVLEAAEELGGPDKLCVMDFGCGLGGAGLAFAAAGYQVYFIDVVEAFLNFLSGCAQRRQLRDCIPVLLNSPGDFVNLKFDKPVGIAVEWSSFEHIAVPLDAYQWITDTLIPGGLFVTTTAIIEWDKATEEHYRLDAGEERFKILRSDEYTNTKNRFAAVHSFENSIAKVLVKSGPTLPKVRQRGPLKPQGGSPAADLPNAGQLPPDRELEELRRFRTMVSSSGSYRLARVLSRLWQSSPAAFRRMMRDKLKH